ncbi:hypothetical protein C5472_01550 [Photorhabdus sp. RW14-46]|uniref:Uncharacterized protein n=1 Tax=Photorhabdus laumondii subsp. clarkei TaxID=2029685 RepID=A0A329VE78_9GAMM|nr:hypothetical protein PluDJC_19775 [Photorhabdus laumondii subsp. laumondii]NHB59894.1 hypothetical protein [Photorhabdus sp. RW14-46]RAW70938.1 hypothetical protein CKY15_10620 [Photorhabdus sp. S7-51]RAW72063.1 hypothetical protein CKY14_10865 [Photorhabdus sp. S14-60]RAW77536.1 hypothetical protein CKY06_11925 [Photorhabdus sp. S15-56]RAW84468.1 hypothetical protein CKY09_12320 [Photorhabdus sp. S5P8-50]RAW85110.1 hypothetical protein CKY12_10785 [Photorhabdus sp. S12-55]RAW89790.1 hypo
MLARLYILTIAAFLYSWFPYTEEANTKKYILVIFQVASLLAALSHPGYIVRYAPGDSLLCRRDAS